VDEEIDYGRKEVDDVLSSVDYRARHRRRAAHGDHGLEPRHGHVAHPLRDDNPFKAGAAIVPVTNLACSG
jgi:hypothetical protein